MCTDALFGVTLICRVLDAEASLAGDFKAIDATQQLGALAGEHWTHDQLDAASLGQVSDLLQVGQVLIASGSE